jgi:hypothetical protein
LEVSHYQRNIHFLRVFITFPLSINEGYTMDLPEVCPNTQTETNCAGTPAPILTLEVEEASKRVIG